jgi:hypothetical protein
LKDSFGNTVETRYFPQHPRLQFVVIRTAVDGKQEVTVYASGGVTKIVPDLGELAMNGSPDEIANAAGILSTPVPSRPTNFMKSTKIEPQPSLQPLPSSAFQRPVTPVIQQPETMQTETSNNSQNAVTPQNPAKEE